MRRRRGLPSPRVTTPIALTPADPAKLALALCHEVGNLLAALRLSAHLLARDAAAGPLRAAGADLEAIAVQAAEILAQLRPLLAAAKDADLVRVDPVEALRATARTLANAHLPAAQVEERGEPAPPVLVEVDALHHVLVALAVAPLQGASAPGHVRLCCAVEEGEIVLAVEDDTGAWAPDAPDPRVGPRGRSLSLEIAATLAARWSGRVIVRPIRAGTRVELRLPPAARSSWSG